MVVSMAAMERTRFNSERVAAQVQFNLRAPDDFHEGERVDACRDVDGSAFS